MKKLLPLLTIFSISAFSLGLAGCDDTPDDLGDAIDNVGDAFDDVGDEIQDSAEDTADAIEDATN